MGNLPIKPEDVQLLNGLKPYLGQKGQAMTDRVLSMIQLLTSESVQQVLEAMVKVMPSAGGTKMAVNESTGNPVTAEGTGAGISSGPMLLFLILILLMQDWGN